MAAAAPPPASMPELRDALLALEPELQAFSAAFETLLAKVEPLQAARAKAASNLASVSSSLPVGPADPGRQLRGHDFSQPPGHDVPQPQSSPPSGAVFVSEEQEERLERRVSDSLLTQVVDIPSSIAGRLGLTKSSVSDAGAGNLRRTLQRISSDFRPAGDHSLELNSRWRELYAANEAQAEEEEEAMLVDHNQSVMDRVGRLSTVYASERSCRAMQAAEDRAVNTKITASIPNCPVLHPVSKLQFAWSCASMLLVLYDAISLPVNVAWNRELQTGGFEFVVFVFATFFWSIDMVLCFNTGFHSGDLLIMSRRRILANYLMGWFLIDLGLLFLDYLYLAMLDGAFSRFKVLRSARFARFTRLLRVARLLRLLRGSSRMHAMANSKLGRRVLELGEAYGMMWLIIVGAVTKSMIVFFLMAHMLACLWFLIGDTAKEEGDASWLDLGIPSGIDVQYMKCLHWSLALMTTNTNDADISPQNQIERIYTILTVFSSILVLGVGASQLASTVQTLNSANAEETNTKRHLQRHLLASDVGEELSARIVKFAVQCLKRRRVMTLDSSIKELLSENLISELTVSQRARHLRIHPLLDYLFTTYPEALLGLCTAFDVKLYSDGETIFNAKTWAEAMLITWHGRYLYTELKTYRSSNSEDDDIEIVEPTYFSELSLYTRVMHSGSLISISFGDAFSLTESDFAHNIRHHPSLIACIYRYATTYLKRISKLPSQNNDIVPQSVTEEVLSEARVIAFDLSTLPALPETSLEDSPDKRRQLISQIFQKKLPVDDVLRHLPEILLELHEGDGAYARMGADEERNRAICGPLCIYLLVQDRYEDFVQVQPEEKRLTRENWQTLQEIVRWANLSEDMLHATFVFLAIRGIGKVKSLTKGLPRDLRASPEDVVLHLIDATSACPSVANLGKDMVKLVQKAFLTHSQFNLAQLLQGENNPSHVEVLQQHAMNNEGDVLLKFYIMNLLGIMSALHGAQNLRGSLFMDKTNGRSVLAGIQCLKDLSTATPHAIYWTYVRKRAMQLGLPERSMEDLVVARLACMVRATYRDRHQLLEAWAKLTPAEQQVLVEHFLADGMQEKAFLFAFLPLYFVNARENPVVGLHRALVVFIGIVELLMEEHCLDNSEVMNIKVDVSDIAAYAREVKSGRIFDALPHFAKVISTATALQITIATAHWNRVTRKNWADEPAQEMNLIMKRMDRRFERIETDILRQPAKKQRQQFAAGGGRGKPYQQIHGLSDPSSPQSRTTTTNL